MTLIHLSLTAGKIISLFIILSFVFIAIGSALDFGDGKTIKTTIQKDGTITYIDLEGGFYGIITSSGEKYLPENLAQQYKKNGLFVHFEGIINDDTMSFMQWGTPVTITKIETKVQVIPTIELYNKGKKVLLTTSQKSLLIPVIDSTMRSVDTVYRCIIPSTEVEQKKKTEKIMFITYGKASDLSTSLGPGDGPSINTSGTSVIEKVKRVAFILTQNKSPDTTANILILQDKKTNYGCYSAGRYDGTDNITGWINEIETIIRQ